MPSAMPSLSARRAPGLSETLQGPRDPRRCQSCGAGHQVDHPLARWLEHDEWDRVPDRPTVVVLCARCEAVLIESHPRLYRRMESGEPFPGCMSICLDCPLRNGTRCASADAKVNGGPGLELRFEPGKEPIHAHFYCGRKAGGSGWRTLYQGKVIYCSSKPLQAESPGLSPGHPTNTTPAIASGEAGVQR